jgi:hypothetical protein
MLFMSVRLYTRFDLTTTGWICMKFGVYKGVWPWWCTKGGLGNLVWWASG